MVTKSEQAIYDAVLERDRMMTYEAGRQEPWHDLAFYLSLDPWVCMAPLIRERFEPRSRLEQCSGEMERDHVHTHTGGTKSKRPPTTMETLVILCHHHHQNGWATGHRPEIRIYIKEANERYKALGLHPGR